MNRTELLELIRLAYVAGIDETNNDCEQWCNQGSAERAEELLEEFEDDVDITVNLSVP